MMDLQYWQTAEAIARELVDRDTDVNEVQKVVTYARIHLDGGQVFALLDLMVRDGRYLVRSGRTMDYYRNLREVFAEHLPGYRTAKADQAREMVAILGWAARLMRFYQTEEGAEEFNKQQREAVLSQSSPPPRLDRRNSAEPAAERPTPPQNRPPVYKEKEEAGFTGTKSKVWVRLASAAQAGKAKVRTEQGEEVSCTGIPFYPVAEAGAKFRADITYANGKAVRAIFKGWK